jgi:hypothetical protein
VCSGLFFVYVVAITVYRARQISQTGVAALFVTRRRAVLQSILVIVNLSALAANTWLAVPALYVFAVTLGLVSAFQAFVALLIGSWQQPPSSPSDP